MTALPPDAPGQRAEAVGEAAPPGADQAGEDPVTDDDATSDNHAGDDDSRGDDIRSDDIRSDDTRDGHGAAPTWDFEPTGVTAADDAAARLRDLDGTTVDRHVEIYEDAHRRLEEGLADLDER